MTPAGPRQTPDDQGRAQMFVASDRGGWAATPEQMRLEIDARVVKPAGPRQSPDDPGRARQSPDDPDLVPGVLARYARARKPLNGNPTPAGLSGKNSSRPK